MARQPIERFHDPNFGKFIRSRRKELYPTLSARTFAKYIGITPSYFSAIELNKVPPPSYDIVIMLAAKLEVSALDLEIMAGNLPKDFKVSDFFKIFNSNNSKPAAPSLIILYQSLVFYEYAKYIYKNNISLVIDSSFDLMRLIMQSGKESEFRKNAAAAIDTKFQEFKRTCEFDLSIEAMKQSKQDPTRNRAKS